MAVGMEAASIARIRLLVMKIYMVANATDMVMQRTLYNVDAYKLISYGLFKIGHAKTPKELADWLYEDIHGSRNEGAAVDKSVRGGIEQAAS